ncbi:MAG: type II toxin-antitoxin system RelE/ParE family toxin [Phycisphaerales bacterium JB063]
MLLFRPEAEADVQSAYRWYESQRLGLGEEFLLSMDAAVASIRDLQQQHPIVYRNTHRTLLRRFPYALFYLVNREQIAVIAVMHQRQDPELWQART